jgi:hypothetical protein
MATKRPKNRNGMGRKISCSKCGGPMEDNRVGKRGYCKKCHAAHMKIMRKRKAIAAYS